MTNGYANQVDEEHNNDSIISKCCSSVISFFAILHSNSNDLVHILTEKFTRGLNVGFWSFFLEYGTVETLEKTKRVSLASPYRWHSKLPGYLYFTLVGIPRPSGLNKNLWTLIVDQTNRGYRRNGDFFGRIENKP